MELPYNEAKYNVQKLIKQKKIEFYNAKLTENIGKPKELWKALKNLGLPSKRALQRIFALLRTILLFSQIKKIQINSKNSILH